MAAIASHQYLAKFHKAGFYEAAVIVASPLSSKNDFAYTVPLITRASFLSAMCDPWS
jgi:hypothetical protein